MIQAFRFIEISKYDDGGQLMTAANLCLEAVLLSYPSSSLTQVRHLYFLTILKPHHNYLSL